MKLKRQQGVAVITALLLTTLAVSIVASLFWQQQVQVRSMENQRLNLQTKWILRGALDWAVIVLRSEGMTSGYTSLDQVWATPLAETRLDQYIERERVQGENFDATLSGNIIDATSRYNLRNLADNGKRDDKQVAIFQRLLTNLQINPQLARQAGDYVAVSQPVEQIAEVPGTETPGTVGGGDTGGAPAPQPVQRPGTSGVPLKLLQLEDLLAIPGFTPAMVEKLRPFVIVLPEKTPVNVNTAAPEVLAAVVPNFSISQANSLVARRKTAPWRDINQFRTEVGADETQLTDDDVGVKSQWFLVQSRIKLDRAALSAESLVQRKLGNAVFSGTSVVWTRQQ